MFKQLALEKKLQKSNYTISFTTVHARLFQLSTCVFTSPKICIIKALYIIIFRLNIKKKIFFHTFIILLDINVLFLPILWLLILHKIFQFSYLIKVVKKNRSKFKRVLNSSLLTLCTRLKIQFEHNVIDYWTISQT